MTRIQLILCTTAFSAVVYLPGVRSRAVDDPARNGRSAAPLAQKEPRAGGTVKALRIASRPGSPE